jgi:hypothetical protein
MMNLISSVPTQTIPLEIPFGPALIVALAVVAAIPLVGQVRAYLASIGGPRRTTLRVVPSH